MTGSICQVDEEFHSACEGPPDHEVRNKQYCILHVPDKDKAKGAFGKALKYKLDQKKYDFSKVVFSGDTSEFEVYDFDADVSFREAVFYGEANLQRALFRLNADFLNVEFSSSRPSFENATFGEEYLSDQTTKVRNASIAGEETSFYGVQELQPAHSVLLPILPVISKLWPKSKWFKCERPNTFLLIP